MKIQSQPEVDNKEKRLKTTELQQMPSSNNEHSMYFSEPDSRPEAIFTGGPL